MDLFSKPEPHLPFEIPHESGYTVEPRLNSGHYKVIVPNGELIYAEGFFDKKIADRSVEYFQENDTLDWKQTKWKNISADKLSTMKFTNINWKQDNIKLYGKVIPLPRLTSWYGENDANYTYSGIMSRPNEWNKGLLYLKARIEECAGVEFNSVLLNWYRDGYSGRS